MYSKLSFARAGPMAAALRRSMSSSAEFKLGVPFQAHLCDGPQVTTATTTKEELLQFHKDMFIIRRMEITSDTEYKERRIRGFCHLYDGQEAVAVGLEAALTKQDDMIGTYRCHGLQYMRGDTVSAIMAEMYGFASGSSKGKGGSMHLYSKKNKFWGGAAIVGAHVPIAAGLGFANKYKAGGNAPMNVAVALYGDGAANQGQCWEAMNMAKLWGLPVISLCENNNFGMGTSVKRHSANVNYYTYGGQVIPGIKVDGMDVLAVKEGLKWARNFCSSGGGPLYVEVNTYRYHGHSMSDPGLTYRDRDEVNKVRETKDCIELVRNRLIEAGWATAAELKAIEKDLRAFVDAETAKARAGKFPEENELYTDIYWKEVPKFIRGVEIGTSKITA